MGFEDGRMVKDQVVVRDRRLWAGIFLFFFSFVVLLRHVLGHNFSTAFSHMYWPPTRQGLAG